MFVILGAAGNTGRVVADTLLAQRKSVRAVVTDSARGQSLKDKGAEVVVADVEDRNALERVFSGAEGAYVLLPPNHSSNQIRADNDRRAKNIAAATAAAGVGHTVLLSSMGAQHPDGTGPILSLHDAEATLEAALSAGGGTRGVTFLRAAYFLENWALGLGTVSQGILPTRRRAPPCQWRQRQTDHPSRRAARLLAGRCCGRARAHRRETRRRPTTTRGGDGSSASHHWHELRVVPAVSGAHSRHELRSRRLGEWAPSVAR